MKNHLLQKTLALLLSAVMLTGLAGCGASSRGTEAAADTAFSTESYAAGAAEYGMEEEWTDEVTMDEGSEESTGTDVISDPSASRKLIYYHDLTIQTTAYEDLLEQVDGLIQQYGAYVENSSEYGSSLSGQDIRSCYMTIRIPASSLEEFEGALSGALGDTGAIINRSERVEDITLSYTDVESRLTALETEQERLLELLAEADTVDDLLAIESRLSEIRYQLEDYESQKRLYDSQITYSYLNLSVDEVRMVEELASASVGERIAAGFTQTLQDLGDRVVDLFVFVVVNLPYLLIWAVVIALVVWIVRRMLKKSRARRAAARSNLPPVPPTPPTPPVPPQSGNPPQKPQ